MSFELPIHFFTIVLNGEPFIRYHLEVFKQLPFKWHWHIIEGVAELKHDTAWSLQHGGQVPAELHNQGHSNDGTSEYLDEISQQFADQITLYRKPVGQFWDGKLEMIRAPIPNIQEECLLWQIDADELWTVEQLEHMRSLFLEHPQKTAAYVPCWFFVGPELIIYNRDSAMYSPLLWLRVWRFAPGMIWAAHEPPTLVEVVPNADTLTNVAQINPFLEAETAAAGLTFQHFAYATADQLLFKEKYYGYANIRDRWQALQQQTRLPVLLRDYFSWLQDGSLVDRADRWGITPLAHFSQSHHQWEFVYNTQTLQDSVTAVAQSPLPTIVVDGAIFQITHSGIASFWQTLLEEWAETGFAQHLIVLDRGMSAPSIPGIRYQLFPGLRAHSIEVDQQKLQEICDQHQAELFVSTYYTSAVSTPSVAIVYDMLPEAYGWRTDTLPECTHKYRALDQAIAQVALSHQIAHQLTNCFPAISSSLHTVPLAANKVLTPASSDAIAQFKLRYGISKPYFLLHSARRAQRDDNRIFFEAFAQLASHQGFEIVYLTDHLEPLAEDLRPYTNGSVVHVLSLQAKALAAAYSGALALAYPARHDGLGLPILEAMQCGCPVLTCKTPFLTEIAAEAALYVPDDVAEWAIALCEIQKPKIRQALISAGLVQAQQFSQAVAATTLQTILLDATLLPLNLRPINLIAFLDWQQPEEQLFIQLQAILQYVLCHPQRQQLTLLLPAKSSYELASMLLSEVTMFLLMEAGLDTEETPEISLVPPLGKLQWQALLPHLTARISVTLEDHDLLSEAGATELPLIELEGLSAIFETPQFSV